MTNDKELSETYVIPCTFDLCIADIVANEVIRVLKKGNCIDIEEYSLYYVCVT